MVDENVYKTYPIDTQD